MSGPAESSDGRAVKANHEPSGEKAADSPTTLTPDTIASVAATVGIGGHAAGWRSARSAGGSTRAG